MQETPEILKPVRPIKRQMRLAFHRQLVLWTHTVLGALTGLAYLTRINLSRFPYWGLNAGAAALLMAAPATLPYVISAIYSRRVVSAQRIRVWAFLGILTAGAIVDGLFFTGAIDFVSVFSRTNLFNLLFVQTLCYIVAAALILDDE